MSLFLKRYLLNMPLLAVAMGWIGLCSSTALHAGGKVEEKDGMTWITVVVPSLPEVSDSSTSGRALTEVLRQFERDFPEIFKKKYQQRYEANPEKYGAMDWSHVGIRLVPFTAVSLEGVENDAMAIAGGNPPDVLYVNFRKSDNYIQNEFLYPLDKAGDGYFSTMSEQERKDRIHPKVWPVIYRKGRDGNKQVWALPSGGVLGRVLAYRKDLFDEAKLSYPTVDWTWKEMYAAAKKLTDPQRGRVGLYLSSYQGWEFSTFLWSAGGEIQTYDEATDDWRCCFGSREGAQALDYYLRLTMEAWQGSNGKTYRGYVTSDIRAATKWEQGEIGMLVAYVDKSFFGGLNPDLVGIAPVSKGPGGGRGSEINSRMLGLYSKIASPVVRDAAWEYILYQESERAMAVRTKILVEGGLGRFLNPRELIRFGYPEVARLIPKGWGEVFDIAEATGRPEPYGRNSNLAYRFLARPVQEAVQLSMRNGLPQDPEKRLQLLEKIMKEGEDEANEVMMGKITPRERTLRNITAVIFLAVVGIGLILFFKNLLKGVKIRRLFSSKGFYQHRMVGLLLAPAILSTLIWKYYPLAAGASMAFQDYRMIGESTWVGVKNFGDVLWDAMWWEAMWNSLRYSFLSLIFGFFPPVILAILLQEIPKGRTIYRLLYYSPAVLSGVVMVLLWQQFYDPSAQGALNALVADIPAYIFLAVAGVVLWASWQLSARFRFHQQTLTALVVLLVGALLAVSLVSLVWPVLREFGILGVAMALPEPVDWVRDPRYAMLSCVIPGIWVGMGPGCLIYLAALKCIPEDCYEAAEMDGANFFDKVIVIVLPSLKSLLLINFIGAFIASWMNSGDTILAMTGGLAGTEVAPLTIFYKAYVYLEYGPATAMAWVLGFVLIGFTAYKVYLLAQDEFYGEGKP